MRVLQLAENRELRFRKHVYYTEFGVSLISRVDLREKMRLFFSRLLNCSRYMDLVRFNGSSVTVSKLIRINIPTCCKQFQQSQCTFCQLSLSNNT